MVEFECINGWWVTMDGYSLCWDGECGIGLLCQPSNETLNTPCSPNGATTTGPCECQGP
jgi:hypothetical protein